MKKLKPSFTKIEEWVQEWERHGLTSVQHTDVDTAVRENLELALLSKSTIIRELALSHLLVNKLK